VKICWPDPDATCLEGGCIHCQDGEEKTAEQIRRWAARAGQVKDRCGGKTRDALEAFERRVPN